MLWCVWGWARVAGQDIIAVLILDRGRTRHDELRQIKVQAENLFFLA